MKTSTFEAPQAEFGLLFGAALYSHETEAHHAALKACKQPMCQLANAILGQDPETETFITGHAVRITVEVLE